MKRQWRVGRLILAILLLGLATLAFSFWPIGPRWKIGDELPLGFDLKQNLLFTGIDNTQEGDGNYELRGYDLATGERRLEKSVKVERFHRDHRYLWRSILSADSNTAACYYDSSPLDPSSSIQVFDIRQQCQRLCRIEVGGLSSVALSANGDILALQKGFEEIEVWNCRTGTMKYRLSLPSKSFPGGVGGIGFSGHFSCSPENMQISSDEHYLAVGTGMGDIAVFDLTAGQAIGHITHSEIPQFLPDSKVLISTPRIYQTGKAQWYVIDSDTIKPLSLSHPMDFEFQGLAISPGLLLTFRWDRATTRTLPKWIPSSIREKLEAALGWKKLTYFVTSMDTSSGRVRDDFIFRVRMYHPAVEPVNIRLSPDGMLLAFKEDAELSLWEIPPRRSFTCWLVCCGIGIIALLLAWPRRVKQSNL